MCKRFYVQYLKILYKYNIYEMEYLNIHEKRCMKKERKKTYRDDLT